MKSLFATLRTGVFALLAGATWLAPLAGWSAAPSTQREPVLRIETGSHLAAINRISSDAQGRWIVTASEDTTVRVWDSRNGQAVSVLRPPLDQDNSGSINAAALSPDGRTVALGGNARYGTGAGFTMHLFDRASASVPPRSTVTGLEAPLTQLAWSPDSKLIAIGLLQEGLRVFTRQLQFVGADPEFNEPIYGADFAADGRLAVASIDGAIRLYRLDAGKLERMARLAAPGGVPYNVAFSPDGKTLAVAYQDQARIDLLDASQLQLVHRIDLGRQTGNLGRVAWASDGAGLYAAGSYVSQGHFPVLYFGNRGKAAAVELGSFSNVITSLQALPEGKLAAASAEPAWAIFNHAGQRLADNRRQGADFRDSDTRFRLSADASVLSFQFQPGGENLVFDLNAGSLKAAPAPDSTAAPLQAGAVDHWKNSTQPRLQGRALQLRPRENARSLAIQASDRSFVLGADWSVRRYASDGALLWEHRVASPAWAVNLSGDGRWVVAGLGDGSVRWLRARDGAEQLALFAHADQSRWIVWTPSGYYDTSVNGENLVGWHLNRAFNQSADYFSAGRFRDRLYRSDVIQKVLASGDEKEALRQAQADLAALELANAEAPPLAPAPVLASAGGKPAAKASQVKSSVPLTGRSSIIEALPPVLELQSSPSIESDAASVPVRFDVRSPDNAPLLGVKARVNGKLVRDLKGKGLRTTGIQEIEVPLPASDAEILLLAENRHGKSDPVAIKVSRPAAATNNLPAVKYDKLYLLIIGISSYPAPYTLDLANKDARDFSHHMAQQSGKLYHSTVQKLLIDDQASRQAIFDGMKWLTESVGEKDAGVIFFAGHGEKIGPNYYFIPGGPQALPAKGEVRSDAEYDVWKKKNAASVWVPGEEIAKTLHRLKGRAIFFVDTCHAGSLARQAVRTSNDMTGELNAISEEKGVIVFASSTGKELSQEDPSWGNGAFTKAIIEGIRGKADKDNTDLILPSYLSAYVSQRVRELTKGEQRPENLMAGLDDPIATETK